MGSRAGKSLNGSMAESRKLQIQKKKKNVLKRYYVTRK